MPRWLRILLAAPLVILALPIAAISGTFFKGRKCTAEELATELQALADGQDDQVDCDRLECVPIKDSRLEEIRRQAARLIQPIHPEDRPRLGQLAAYARALKQ